MPKQKSGNRPQQPSKPSGLRYVERTRGGSGEVYLYYKRAGRRIPLPQPEGSAEFLAAYERAAATFGPAQEAATSVSTAIDSYLASADFSQLAAASKRDYRYYLTNFNQQFGQLAMTAINSPWLEGLRDKYSESPNQWNALRARMVAVTDHFMRRHPAALPANYWRLARRLKTEPSDQNKPWPVEVLRAVFGAATPQFRALLTAYLLTAQRGGDVTTITASQYDRKARTLTFTQGKTDEPMVLPVPDALAAVLEGDGRLLHSPRGKAWTLDNAQQTLARLLLGLGLPRYTLHGLRSTGPSALRERGMDNALLRALTGHTTDKNLEIYLRKVNRAPAAKIAGTALASIFEPLLMKAIDENDGDADKAKVSHKEMRRRKQDRGGGG